MADPGFHVEGRQPSEEAPTPNVPTFRKLYVKMKESGPLRGRVPAATSLDPPMWDGGM